MTKGRIVLVPFPFDDLVSIKVRPALCLTEPIGLYRHVVVGFVSSQVPPSIGATDVLIDPRRADFGATGLKVASIVRLHRLITLPISVVRRDLGHLSPVWQKEVNQKLAVLFGL